jgi:SpoVK/Ycf46/Vps4 family AAA+-type ATPase
MLLTELDGLDSHRGAFVLAATNWPDMLDLAMCCPGWLDKLLYVDLPSPDEHAEITNAAAMLNPHSNEAPRFTGRDGELMACLQEFDALTTSHELSDTAKVEHYPPPVQVFEVPQWLCYP